MVDEEYVSDIPTIEADENPSGYISKSIHDFFDILVPVNLDAEMELKYDDMWHIPDYSISSPTITDDMGMSSSQIRSYFKSALDDTSANNSQLRAYDASKTFYLNSKPNAMPSSIYIYDILFDLMSASTPKNPTDLYTVESTTDYGFDWQDSNQDFPLSSLKINILPLTESERIVASMSEVSNFKSSNYLSLVMKNKFGFLLSYNHKDTSVINRRMVMPLVFRRKPASSGEDIKSLEINITPYSCLELDPDTTQQISGTKTIRGLNGVDINYILLKARITGFTGAPAHAKSDRTANYSVLEAIKYMFNDGDCVMGCSTYDSTYIDYVPDVPSAPSTSIKYKKSPDFPIIIDRIYRDETSVFIEYYIRSDYKTMQAAVGVGYGVTDLESSIFTGPSSGNINIITTGKNMVSAYVHNIFNPYGEYQGFSFGENSQPTIANLGQNFSAGKNAYEDIHMSNDGWGNNIGVGKTISDLGVIATFTCNSLRIDNILKYSMFMLVMSYEWSPYSIKSLVEDGMGIPESAMRDVSTLNTRGGAIVDAPGISLSFNMIRE